MNKSKVIRSGWVVTDLLGYEFEWRKFGGVKCFRYLEVDMVANGTMEAEESHRTSDLDR